MPEILDRIKKLERFSLLEGMGVRELHAMASVLSVEDFKPDDIMITEGDENSAIYLVVSGKVTIYGDYGKPEQRHKAVIGEGSFLGELSMFTRLPPNATCVAIEDTRAFVLPHHQFVEIMRVYPQIGINLCRFFSQKLREAKY
jgi:CRP-like cAMP-binding protein